MRVKNFKKHLVGFFLIIIICLLYLLGKSYSSWNGLAVLVLIWLFGLSIIALGIFLSEKFGKKWSPVLIVGMLSGFTILADLASIKVVAIELGGVEFVAPSGSLMFAVLYFGGDYLNEVYGKDLARINVYAGWFSKIAVALGIFFVIYFMKNPTNLELVQKNSNFDTLLSMGPRLNLASISAILIAGLVNVELFNILRKFTKGKYLWLRSSISSAIAIFVDNIIFTLAAFLFVLPFKTILNMVLTTSIVHLTIALWSIPYLYSLRALKHAGILGSNENLLIEVGKNVDEK